MAPVVGPHSAFEDFLRVEATGDGAWSSALADFDWGAAFGGDLLARMALAASRDVGPERALRSLHAHFLAPATPGSAAALHVTPLGDDAHETRRRVAVTVGGATLCEGVASFAATAAGPRYHAGGFDASLAAPESLPSDVELAQSDGWPVRYLAPIEFRRAEPRAWPFPAAADGEASHWSGWLRPRVPLSADLALHAAALVFASDYRSHWGPETRLGPAFGAHAYTSLDHALWIHAPQAWTDWWLFETRSEICRDGRALTQRTVWTRDGLRVATIAQEGLLRPR